MAPLPKVVPSREVSPAPAAPGPPGDALAPPAAEDFPCDALGPGLAAAARAAAARSQAPAGLLAHHLLTLAAMAAQRAVSLRLPGGGTRAVSCWFATLVGSGERRDEAEKLTAGLARAWEEAAEAGDRPRIFERRMNLFFAPPALGRRGAGYDRYAVLRRLSGMFLRHPSDFVTPDCYRRAEAASLCALWDGKVEQIAAAAPVHARLSLHLVVAPGAARALLHDPEIEDIGLTARLLLAAPPPRVGARAFTGADSAEAPPALGAYLDRLYALYRAPVTTGERVVGLSAAARELWLAFANAVEKEMRAGGDYAGIRAFAGRLPEHAARLACVTAFVEDAGLAELAAADLERGIALARHYARENMRLRDAESGALTESEKAERLKEWLERKRAGGSVALREICRLGPAAVRDSDTALRLMRRMERMGVVQAVSTPGAAGAARRKGVVCEWSVPAAPREVA